ncbi:MAG: NAD(P)H-hydrate dehydratase [Acidimicrobiales bacterium]|nr:NAD(P)H-hydrate dehydratase [Acidimicrobiales bacterium]
MIGLLSTDESRELDKVYAKDNPIEILIDRAGYAIYRQAIKMMKGSYSKRVLVICGPGMNGSDGRVASKYLIDRGVKTSVCTQNEAEELLRKSKSLDLVIDAAFGTGLSREYNAPVINPQVPVLAVDIPSGLNGDSGLVLGNVMKADTTVTFVTPKIGFYFGRGPELVGKVVCVDIGLDPALLGSEEKPFQAKVNLVEDSDVRVPKRPRNSHKWNSAVLAIGGSPGMMGAPHLSALASYRSGAGMVRLITPGSDGRSDVPSDVVQISGVGDWVSASIKEASRCQACIIGPGLGRDESMGSAVLDLLEKIDIPVVLDADGLFGMTISKLEVVTSSRSNPIVITPHEGEFYALTGRKIDSDKIGEANSLALKSGCIVLIKGSPTVISLPNGSTRLITNGSPRLSSAGTGDVLSGVIAGTIARYRGEGLSQEMAEILDQVAFATHLHAMAASIGQREGLVASDLPQLVSKVLSEMPEHKAKCVE